MNTKEKEDALTLEILQTIEHKEDVTQRHLADNLGVALGLANSYLKRCAHKGFIKIQQVPANRYLYYLTPKGFAEKSRLTAQYLSYSFDFYRKASESINQSLVACCDRGYQRIVFCGVSELAEIASLRMNENELEHVATFDIQFAKTIYLSKSVWRGFENKKEFDACLVTALLNPEQTYLEITKQINKNKIFVPDILGLSL